METEQTGALDEDFTDKNPKVAALRDYFPRLKDQFAYIFAQIQGDEEAKNYFTKQITIIATFQNARYGSNTTDA